MKSIEMALVASTALILSACNSTEHPQEQGVSHCEITTTCTTLHQLSQALLAQGIFADPTVTAINKTHETSEATVRFRLQRQYKDYNHYMTAECHVGSTVHWYAIAEQMVKIRKDLLSQDVVVTSPIQLEHNSWHLQICKNTIEAYMQTLTSH